MDEDSLLKDLVSKQNEYVSNSDNKSSFNPLHSDANTIFLHRECKLPKTISKEKLNSYLSLCVDGDWVRKTSSKGKMSKRRFFISKQFSSLCWEQELGKKKKSFSFSLCGCVKKGVDSYLSKKSLRKLADKNPNFQSKAISLYCSALRDPIVFLCNSDEECKRWLLVLDLCISITNLKTKTFEWFCLKIEWDESDKSPKEVLRALRNSNIKVTKREITTIFNKLQLKKADSKLKFEEFFEIHLKLFHRKEFAPLFEKYSRPSSQDASVRLMAASDFSRFLRHEQKMPLKEPQVVKVMREILERSEAETGINQMSLVFTKRDFISFLSSELNYPVPARMFKSGVMDMDRPIEEYFVASSHNTYLESSQYKGNSSVEMYISALKRGCKCVEIDCWDGAKGLPVVYHGHTLTEKINFWDVIQTIKEYAFFKSPYPLVISLENNCSPKQQYEMSRMMEEVFGGVLAVRTSGESKKPFTPKSLTGKIILKGSMHVAVEPLKKQIFLRSKKFLKKHLERKFSSDLTDCEIQTFSEKSFNKIRASAKKFKKHSAKKIIRTYPSYSRVNSSNYNPVTAWSLGVQMAALNYQTRDKQMILNDGMFSINGNCGYVLKPDSYRSARMGPDRCKSEENLVTKKHSSMKSVSTATNRKNVSSLINGKSTYDDDKASVNKESRELSSTLHRVKPKSSVKSDEKTKIKTIHFIKNKNEISKPLVSRKSSLGYIFSDTTEKTKNKPLVRETPEKKNKLSIDACAKIDPKRDKNSTEDTKLDCGLPKKIHPKMFTKNDGIKPETATRNKSGPKISSIRNNSRFDRQKIELENAENNKEGSQYRAELFKSRSLGTYGRWKETHNRRLKIEVISASQLPKNKSDKQSSQVVNPFVEINIYSSSTKKRNARTKTIYGNGFNPVWQEKFNFEFTESELDVCMILFRVYSSSGLKTKSLLAANSFPVSYLLNGYRFIPLKNRFDEVINCCGVYCYVKFDK